MAYTGRIAFTNTLCAAQDVLSVQSQSYVSSTDRDSWLDTFDLTTVLSASQLPGTTIQLQCYKRDLAARTEVSAGAVMLADTGTAALALDRTQRSNYQPIILWI